MIWNRYMYKTKYTMKSLWTRPIVEWSGNIIGTIQSPIDFVLTYHLWKPLFNIHVYLNLYPGNVSKTVVYITINWNRHNDIIAKLPMSIEMYVQCTYVDDFHIDVIVYPPYIERAVVHYCVWCGELESWVTTQRFHMFILWYLGTIPFS